MKTMSRIIKRVDYRIRADQLDKIDCPKIRLFLSRNYSEYEEYFEFKLKASEEEQSTFIHFKPVNGILSEERYVGKCPVPENTLGNVLTDIIKTNLSARTNVGFRLFLTSYLLMTIKPLLFEDGYFYMDPVTGQWIGR